MTIKLTKVKEVCQLQSINMLRVTGEEWHALKLFLVFFLKNHQQRPSSRERNQVLNYSYLHQRNSPCRIQSELSVIHIHLARLQWHLPHRKTLNMKQPEGKKCKAWFKKRKKKHLPVSLGMSTYFLVLVNTDTNTDTEMSNLSVFFINQRIFLCSSV